MKPYFSFFAVVWLVLSYAVIGRGFEDPNAPEVFEVPAGVTAGEPEDLEKLTFHRAPKPLAEEAVTEDWPRFLGPNDNGTSGETKLLSGFPKEGLAKVWELSKGSG